MLLKLHAILHKLCHLSDIVCTSADQQRQCAQRAEIPNIRAYVVKMNCMEMLNHKYSNAYTIIYTDYYWQSPWLFYLEGSEFSSFVRCVIKLTFDLVSFLSIDRNKSVELVVNNEVTQKNSFQTWIFIQKQCYNMHFFRKQRNNWIVGSHRDNVNIEDYLGRSDIAKVATTNISGAFALKYRANQTLESSNGKHSPQCKIVLLIHIWMCCN